MLAAAIRVILRALTLPHPIQTAWAIFIIVYLFIFYIRHNDEVPFSLSVLFQYMLYNFLELKDLICLIIFFCVIPVM